MVRIPPSPPKPPQRRKWTAAIHPSPQTALIITPKNEQELRVITEGLVPIRRCSCSDWVVDWTVTSGTPERTSLNSFSSVPARCSVPIISRNCTDYNSIYGESFTLGKNVHNSLKTIVGGRRLELRTSCLQVIRVL